MIYSLTGLIAGCILGFILGVNSKHHKNNDSTALKLANTMNASMLQCVTENVITPEQVHGIETIFHKHIEENFSGIKASHGTEK
jgi:hypothetical protein